MSSEKRKILSSTNQDSAEKQEICKTEEKQISDKEVENIPKKEQTLQTVSRPHLPLYIKSYSETRIEPTILDHTWKIYQFMHFSTITNTTTLPSIPEIGQCVIRMNVSRQVNLQKDVIAFYILTSKSFYGSCVTTIMLPTEDFGSSNSISGPISNKTLLIKISTDKFQQLSPESTLTIRCKLKIYHHLINKSIRMNLVPSLTEFSKNVTCFEDSTSDEFRFKDEKSIKFIVGKEQYVISKKLLCSTNSSYFKNICLTHEGKEKDMTDELIANSELQTFKQILVYIITGSLDQCDYNVLKKLLATADKYDVPALKLTCEHYLLHYITIDNAVELLQLAFASNAKFLEKHSANFVKFHIEDIRDVTEFENILQEDLNKILELIEKSEILEISTHQLFSSPLMTDKFTLAGSDS
ncbi:speckle-type POZ protein homolog isoform X1 [Temnothorax nylanderi]|uniref:speckle-type POZ protein homolog isoform X1 n=1 Tax=Temnothorax nylanderi TaxID=102681 RepID=UPI003A8A56CD